MEQTLKVLIAEDSLTNRLVLKAMLDSLGCTVHMVENGEEAVDTCASNTYDCIFMDLHMPVLDGFAAIEKIRDDTACNSEKTVIIACTADILTVSKAKCFTSGATDYINKPFKKIDIENILAKYF